MVSRREKGTKGKTQKKQGRSTKIPKIRKFGEKDGAVNKMIERSVNEFQNNSISFWVIIVIANEIRSWVCEKDTCCAQKI